jgi:hypothetical protein
MISLKYWGFSNLIEKTKAVLHCTCIEQQSRVSKELSKIKTIWKMHNHSFHVISIFESSLLTLNCCLMQVRLWIMENSLCLLDKVAKLIPNQVSYF